MKEQACSKEGDSLKASGNDVAMMLLCWQSNFPGFIKAKTCRGEHQKPDFLFGFQFSFTNQLFLQQTDCTNDHSMCSMRHPNGNYEI